MHRKAYERARLKCEALEEPLRSNRHFRSREPDTRLIVSNNSRFADSYDLGFRAHLPPACPGESPQQYARARKPRTKRKTAIRHAVI
jgi:hypothetical protein